MASYGYLYKFICVICVICTVDVFLIQYCRGESVATPETSAEADGTTDSKIDCGTSCAYLLVRALGADYSEKFLTKTHVYAPSQGRSLKGMRDLLGQHGIDAMSLYYDTPSLKSLRGPFIAHWYLDPAQTQGHYVLVIPDSDGGWVFDPLMKKPVYSSLSKGCPFDRLFSGHIVAPLASIPPPALFKFRLQLSAAFAAILALTLIVLHWRKRIVLAFETGLTSKMAVSVQRSRAGALLLLVAMGCGRLDESTDLSFKKPADVRLGDLEFPNGLDIDFGEVSYATEYEFEIPFRNGGVASLDISNIENQRPCCFKGHVSASPKILKPGESGILRIHHRSGVRTGRILVACELGFPNARAALGGKELVINFSYKTTGNTPFVRFDEEQLNFGTVDVATDNSLRTHHTELHLSRESDDFPVDIIVELDVVRESVSFDLGEPIPSTVRSGQNAWRVPVSVHFDPRLTAPGRVAGRVDASFNGRSTSIPYFSTVVDGYEIQPFDALVIVSKNGRFLNNEIVVRGVGGRKAVISDRIGCDSLIATVQQISDSESCIRLMPVESVDSSLDNEIVEFTVGDNEGFERSYVVPVQLVKL